MDDANIHWGLCFLCQEVTKEPVSNPAWSTNANNGYVTLANNLTEVNKIGNLPFDIDVSLLSNKRDLENVLAEQKAVWHKTCYSKCNDQKLQRAQKKAQKRSQNKAVLSEDSLVKIRKSSRSSISEEVCLFCEFPGSKLNPLSKLTAETHTKKNSGLC